MCIDSVKMLQDIKLHVVGIVQLLVAVVEHCVCIMSIYCKHKHCVIRNDIAVANSCKRTLCEASM
jgi:hypothetical protein